MKRKTNKQYKDNLKWKLIQLWSKDCHDLRLSEIIAQKANS